MKATFTCEKCDHEYGGVDGLTMGTQTTREKIVDAMKRFERKGCPNCGKLTYGPLTEEMVAEALCEAKTNSNTGESGEDWAHWYEIPEGTGSVRDSFRHEARFVLRLLNILDDDGIVADGFFDSGANQRGWLLAIAGAE